MAGVLSPLLQPLSSRVLAPPLSLIPGTPSQLGPQQDAAEMQDPQDRDDDGRCFFPPLTITQLTGSHPPPLLVARAVRPSDGKEEPPGSPGGGRASPAVEPEDSDDERGEWDATSAESIEANVYVTFVSPGIED